MFIGVLQNTCSQKFYKIHRKITATEMFSKVAGLFTFAALLKNVSIAGVYFVNFENYADHIFYRTPSVDCL